ncbi:TonB-dependent receptor [Haliscomenobacter hydrossis]|uniref:TonB-dependent receptor n=1 Tax=Haliscomenobacter hydrossis (strain ATCC 27775 / DSM 1100 / LMG 10767 / O) TaxID=760192 RepID=F4L2W3_HALH1|nr:TonB-dependent receptor [Haliscomenobacter hydrossis]AEE49643.1 TonB-dependent receptor [Haliscomenobacter hydrossis DSM 1100]
MRLLSLFLVLLPFTLFSQSIKGKIFGKTPSGNEILPGATLTLVGTPQGAVSNEFGVFEINVPADADPRLLVSFLGFKTDTVAIAGRTYFSIYLEPDAKNLEAASVVAQQGGSFISALQGIKVEVINQKELTKAACCDLAGCFETQGTIQAQTTNLLLNSKELRILGLSGVYNQILVDGMPMILGSTFTYGISSIPGTLVDQIFVAKGANSVLQGFESISGQVNVVLKDPNPDKEKFLLNAYLNSFGEKHLNANFSTTLGKSWKSLTSLHLVQPASKRDRDEDTFLDLPLLTRLAIYQKFTVGDEQSAGWSSKIGLRYLDEKRIGGQTTFDAKSDQGSNQVYGQVVQYQQPELYTKTGYRFTPQSKISLIASAFQHQQSAWFGVTQYASKHLNAYANLQYEHLWAQKHDLKFGFSYRHLNLDETIRFSNNDLERTFAGDYQRQERTPGMFAENVFNFEQFSIIAGARVDHHRQFGWQFVPRLTLRYNAGDATVIRANVGRGLRSVNLFAENISLLISSRDIQFSESLDLEKAWNTGVNLTHTATGETLVATFSVDLYHTRFQNQIFPDYDSDPGLAIIQNFRGTSISNGFQFDAKFVLAKIFEAKFAYNFLDVYRRTGEQKIQLPFNARHRLVSAFSYEPKNKQWHADVNVHWMGPQRLPNTQTLPESFQQPDFSRAYAVTNVQFTKVWKKLDVYAGCENIFDFRQLRPIINWQNPFGEYFDTAFAWGPTRGRELYVGVRMKW